MGIVFRLVGFFLFLFLSFFCIPLGGPLVHPLYTELCPWYSFFLISIYSLRFTYPKKKIYRLIWNRNVNRKLLGKIRSIKEEVTFMVTF